MNDLNPILDKIKKELKIEFVDDFHITVIYSNRVIFDEYAEQIHQRLNRELPSPKEGWLPASMIANNIQLKMLKSVGFFLSPQALIRVVPTL